MGAGGKVVFGWNRMVFRGDGGDLSVLTAGGGGERDQAQLSDTSKFLQPGPPPLSPLQKKHSS